MGDEAIGAVSEGSPVSVVVCAYTLDRWPDLTAAIDSIRTQQPAPSEVVLVVDHNDELLERARAWTDVRVVASDQPQGLSGARNAGVAAASGDVIAFLDDDARAEAGWLAALTAPFNDPAVVATGGHAEAAWDGGRPRWFPREFDWVVGCSYIGLPAHEAVVRNPIGCSMAFRRAAIQEAGGFRSGVGRVGRLPIGGEETELCIRIQAARPDSRVVYVPAARVRHRVPASRARWAYFRSRCYQEGRSKALISRWAGAGPALASERRYTTRVLPAGVLRGAAEAVRGDPGGLLRAVVIPLGLAMTTVGYLADRAGLDRL